eukprot:GHVR01027806.1.p1 GENE.GHVR01027806.1~~GHVR01027806.1.p1  ORF type:complete len:123 (+),score=5.62 GHVR01027806.1:2884-3252(+)
MPQYAADPSESDFIKTYDRIMLRFSSHYGKQPDLFIKAPACPNILGDDLLEVGYSAVSLCSAQNVIIAIATNGNKKIRFNNYQNAIYGENTFETDPSLWKFDKNLDESYTNTIIATLKALVT